MAVEVYQGTIGIKDNNTYQQAVKEIFSLAGYSVTPDATAKRVTVDNGGNVFGHGSFKMCGMGSGHDNKLVMLVDKDQHALIVSSALSVNNSYNTESVAYQNGCGYSINCLLCGDIDDGDIVDGDNKGYSTVFNIANLNFSRVGNQPCIVTPCIDWGRKNLSPIFIAANGVVYPLGTYVTDGSTKFVSNGNGLLIKVKE